MTSRFPAKRILSEGVKAYRRIDPVNLRSEDLRNANELYVTDNR